MLPDDSEEDDLFREESMLRKIIEIDETACNGCGLCVAACHEGAIGLVEGKARLLPVGRLSRIALALLRVRRS